MFLVIKINNIVLYFLRDSLVK